MVVSFAHLAGQVEYIFYEWNSFISTDITKNITRWFDKWEITLYVRWNSKGYPAHLFCKNVRRRLSRCFISSTIFRWLNVATCRVLLRYEFYCWGFLLRPIGRGNVLLGVFSSYHIIQHGKFICIRYSGSTHASILGKQMLREVCSNVVSSF